MAFDLYLCEGVAADGLELTGEVYGFGETGEDTCVEDLPEILLLESWTVHPEFAGYFLVAVTEDGEVLARQRIPQPAWMRA